MNPLRIRSLALLLLLSACTETNGAANDGDDADGDDSGSTGDTTSATTMPGATTTTAGPTTTTTASTTAGPTTDDPDTSGGTDDTDDTSTGAPAVCDGICFGAPEGWSGPVVAYDVAAGEEDPGCSGVFATEVARHHADPDLPAAVCGCECSAAVGASCTTPSLRYHLNAAGCDVSVGAHIPLQEGCNNIADIGEATFNFNEPVLTPGMCLPMSTTDLPAPSFAREVVLCGGELDATGCDPELGCVPPMDAPICVWQEGVHECPGEFPVAQPLFTDFSDTRSCSACTCGDAEGTCEMDPVRLYPENNQCNFGLLPTETVEPGGCTEHENETMSIRLSEPEAVTSCPPSPVEAMGELVTTGPFTLCCAS